MKNNAKHSVKKTAASEIENPKNLEVYIMHHAQKTMLQNFLAQMRKKRRKDHETK